MEERVEGYKVFNPDWTCRGKQYSCPGRFEEDVELELCKAGMHFCRRLCDCANYYNLNSDNHVAKVIAYGEVLEKDNKCCTNKIEILYELSREEILSIVNIGKNCTGSRNVGNNNSGNGNTGNNNSGNRNAGNNNEGIYNTGSYNSGNLNCGNFNSGRRNTGHYNSGNYNTGETNTGNHNTGNHNIGDWNSGDWNSTDFSSGCFNTLKTPIYLFNKLSDWTYDDWIDSEANGILITAPRWTSSSPRIEKEKLNQWWNALTKQEQKIIMEIPNFDKDIFKKITGIDVNI